MMVRFRLMIEPSLTPFDLSGEYGGIVYNDAGKRRLRLCVAGTEYLLKVPRILRRWIIAHYRMGQPIRLLGSEERDPAGVVVRRVAAEAVPLSGGDAQIRRAAADAIQICTKKNCWRQGGRELWAALESGLAEAGLAGQIELKGVSCLDRCRMAPNADWQGCAYRQCTPADARAIIARAVQQSEAVPVRDA